MPDADPLLGSVASEVVRYLASFAMTAVATVVAVGVDSTVTISNLSLVFVVPVIIAGVSLGLGPSLCSAILGADGPTSDCGEPTSNWSFFGQFGRPVRLTTPAWLAGQECNPGATSLNQSTVGWRKEGKITTSFAKL